MNKDLEPSAFWRAKGVFMPHLVSILDSNLVVYQDSFQSVDNVMSKYFINKYPTTVSFYNFNKKFFRFCPKKFAC